MRGRSRTQGGGLRLTPRDDEREETHADGHECGEAEQGGEFDAGTLDRSRAERGDSVAELVERDDESCGCGGHHHELFLAEADRERKQRRTAEAGDTEREDPERGVAVGELPDRDEGSREHERQEVVRASGGNHRWMAAKPTRPIVTHAQKVVSASDAIVVDVPRFFMSSDAQFPFIVSQTP